ncbi:dNA topoisomerase IV A subunit [Clostridium sp. CAG:609]|nr:dNA topoisomerase IV A subunit [Clostridium sp. CAG:609]
MDIIKRIEDYSLEEIMSLRFAAYAKEIIQDRAIPDVRDGLKPVQRRILYAMYKAGNTSDKGYIKCAATVGDVLGKFHPHGDLSVYDAMVRMSQWWKQSAILVDIHGNNGSMDGDPPAAYRYTESRLAKISNELLKDLDKNTVAWAPNFDDRFLEPTVLPAKFPNLLVNGTNGISAGYATNIPPHNLGEIIDATIKRIDSPNCYLDTILEIVKGPDFPTGGIAFGKEGIIDAFKTGRGKVIVQAKYEFVKEKGKEQIIITEIPFEVNKQATVAKIESLRIDKKIEGISEVRDETDRSGIRIAIDLKSNANKEVIMKYLFKNTDLQISYNYNSVAIVNRTPKTLGILEIIDAYIAHQKEVITKRTEFDLAYYTKNYNIATGLIKAISILDEVIALIRASKNKSDAKINLVNKYGFTEEQAEAIVTLQLYKLTNTDIVVLKEECEKLKNLIEECNEILHDENKLKNLMKSELREVKKNYAVPRKTEIRDEIVDIKLDAKEMIPDEKCVIVVTNDGYVKRVSQKSFSSSTEETTLKPGDYVTNKFMASTRDSLLLFTNLGNYLYVPIHILPEVKYKDLGKHISNTIMIKEQERIVASLILKDKSKTLTLFTKKGLTKQVLLKDFEVTRYSKPMMAIKLKDDDELINADTSSDEVLFVTNNGLYLRFNTNEIPVVGTKASGVKGINLKDDYVIYASPIKREEYLNIYTNYKTIKRVKVNELVSISRAKKGNMLFKKAKTKDYKINFAYLTVTKDTNIYRTDNEIHELKTSEIPIMDLASTGSSVKYNYDLFALKKELIDLTKVEKNDDKEDVQITDEEVKPTKKEEQLSFASFIDDFKI